jgi:hypothetical protein
MKQSEPETFSFIEPMMALQIRELPVGNWLTFWLTPSHSLVFV